MNNNIPINDQCIACGHYVLDGQRGISCDGCMRWCHISCDTGISNGRYQQMIDNTIVINWKCHTCLEIQNRRGALEYGQFTIERDHQEVTIENPIASLEPIDFTIPLEYKLKLGTSTRGGDMLVDNHGHAYQMKRDNLRNTVHWRCKYNKPPHSCKNSLRQINSTTLRESTQPHTCNPVAGIEKKD